MCSCIAEQFVCPGKDMLIAGFSSNIVGVRFAVCEAVRTGLTVFRKPEAQRICGCLSCFIGREAARGIAGIAIHQDRLHTRKCRRREHGRRRCGSIGSAMGIPFRMFNTVTDLPGAFYPVSGRIQVMPCSVLVVLKIVKSRVCLALNGYGRLCCERCSKGHYSNNGKHTKSDISERGILRTLSPVVSSFSVARLSFMLRNIAAVL